MTEATSPSSAVRGYADESAPAASGRGLAVAGWSLAIVVTVALLMPRLVVPGGYADGLLYASMARNLAIGIGDWWQPHFSDTTFPIFHEHPPLMMIACSWLFRLLGDYFWTEKLFSTLILAVGMVGLRWLWRPATSAQPQLWPFGWIAPLLWVLFPLTAWLTTNHMLELPVAVCAVVTAGCIVRGAGRAWPIWYLAGAATLVLGFLCKGPLALFPLAMPAMLAAPHGRRAFAMGCWRSAALTAMLAGLLALCLIDDRLRDNLDIYWHEQVLSSLAGSRGVHPQGRLHLLWLLIRETIPVAIPVSIVVMVLLRGRLASLRPAFADSAGWLLVALSGSLPLLASPRHNTHYLAGCQPFFALALAVPMATALADFVRRRPQPWHDAPSPVIRWSAGVALIIIACFGVEQYGGTKRDQPWMSEVEALAPILACGEVIGADATLTQNREYRLHVYLQRYLQVSVDGGDHRDEHIHYLASMDGAPPAGAELVVSIPSTKRALYRLPVK